MLGTLPETVKFKIYFITGNAITKWGRSEGQNYFDALKRNLKWRTNWDGWS